MSQTTVQDGSLIVKDPNAILVYVIDYDAARLAAGVEISTSAWSITGPDATLTSDQDAILSGNRKTRIRLTAGTLGGVYTVTNRIVTNESPAQTIDASFRIRIEEQ